MSLTKREIGVRVSDDGEAVIILFSDVYYGRLSREQALSVADTIREFAMKVGPKEQSILN